jgi:SAM-dependent methyltransferase
MLPPLPPPHFRRLVTTNDAVFELANSSALIDPYLTDPRQYRAVFDFGCGCGRIARQLLVQNPRPKRYLGIDIHSGMVKWCRNALSPLDPAFQFQHHDVWNLGIAPENKRQSTAPFPAGAREFSYVIAHSVFTHIYKEQTEFYLGEISRILAEDGIARTTWFLFDPLTFPMLFEHQVCLYVNEIDPTNAVIYDWAWMLRTVRSRGLKVVHTEPPTVRGHQWNVHLALRTRENEPDAFPEDRASRLMMCGSGIDNQGVTLGPPRPAEIPVREGRSPADAPNELLGDEGAPLRPTRFAESVYESRPDVRQSFPDPYGRDRAGFLMWFLTHGAREHKIEPELLEPMQRQWDTVLASLSPASRLLCQVKYWAAKLR